MPEPEEPWYGKKRYEIVDQVLDKIEEKERANKLTPVEAAALRAQAPYLTTSMKDLGSSYQGPPKYLSQRDAPLEIPIEVIKNLFCAMDEDIDDKVSLQELKNYIANTGVPIDSTITEEMFVDATKSRPIIHEAQKYQGLTIEEIQYAVRGRFNWNTERKEWSVSYKPYRNYWLLLLLTVSERLFALQVPKVIPEKITAQYEEQEQLKALQDSIRRGELTFKKKEGLERKYLSFKETRKSLFTRNADKIEASINLEGTLKFTEEKIGKASIDPYDKQVNFKVIPAVHRDDPEALAIQHRHSITDPSCLNDMPKFNFDTKELYEHAHHLC